MQDVDLAIGVLEDAAAQGMRGSNWVQHQRSEPFGDARFFPFYAACERLGMSLFIHPWDMMGSGYGAVLVAMACRHAGRDKPGGVFHDLCWGARQVSQLAHHVSHAGGSLPTMGRIKHGHACRPDLVAVDNPQSPDTYLGRFWVDSITHDERLLRFILDMQGADRICMGTDYPLFPLGDLEFGNFMESMGSSNEELLHLGCHVVLVGNGGC